MTRDRVREVHQGLLGELAGFSDQATADLAALLNAELRHTLETFEALKIRRGALTFTDLLFKTRNLLRNSPAARHYFQERFTHIFVDEFQDTDPMQAEILMLLAAEEPGQTDWEKASPTPGKLFIVGDPKQSIYRFRRADVRTYHQVKSLLHRDGSEPVRLSTSFRSTPEIQAFVNAAFAPLMNEDPSRDQSGYVPLQPYRGSMKTQPSIVALPVPRPLGKRGAVTATAVRESLPDAVGAFVHWLLRESGWTVSTREGREPIAARHICLLFRRFQDAFAGDLTDRFAEALDARELPHLVIGGRSFHQREEIEGLRAALAAIERPEDELMVFATLKGSLFSIPDDLLLEYRAAAGLLDPLRPLSLSSDRFAPITDALSILASLHRDRNSRPAADTLSRLLAETRAHGGFAFRPNGERILSNVMQLGHLARAYEASGGLSFRGFVDQLQRAAESRHSPEAPLMEEDSDGVRLMTVHKAKGLEFPVVLLADLTTRSHWSTADRYVDPQRGLAALRIAGWRPRELIENEEIEVARDQSESVRLAYVAATRARDILVVPAVGSTPFDGWLAPLTPALYPPPDAAPGRAPGCPDFGDATILEGVDGGPFRGVMVRPGRYEHPGYDVVWWDPGVLRLGTPPSFGLRQHLLLDRNVAPDVVEADRKRYEEWRSHRESTLQASSTPTDRVRIVTDPDTLEAFEPGPVRVEDVDRTPARPTGPRFGSLVHAVLSEISFTADREAIQREAALRARLLGGTLPEEDAAVTAVEAALAHPLMQRAASADEIRRECPVSLWDEGQLTEGVLDLAFRIGQYWTVVDFKTDVPQQERLDRYRRQVSVYALAVRRATGLPCDAILFRV